MNIVVVGGVAAGTSAATKARRNNESASIKLFEQDRDISYAMCGIPYYLGGEVKELEALAPRNAAFFKKRHNVDVFTRHRVERITLAPRTVQVRNLDTGETWDEPFDKLVLATGAAPFVPQVYRPHLDAGNVFPVRTLQGAAALHSCIESQKPKSAVIVGAGMIGLEMAEQLVRRGLRVTLLQRDPQVMTPMDADMACRVHQELEANGVEVRLNADVTTVTTGSDGRVQSLGLADGSAVPLDLLVLAAGVRPNVELAVAVGIRLGHSGAIAVNSQMQSSIAGIYAVGDVAESYSAITGKPLWRPMGTTANKTGRIAGDAMTGGSLRHRGVLGTGIARVFGITAAFTGMNVREAKAEGYEVVAAHSTQLARAGYIDEESISIKAVANRADGRLLGAQIVGAAGVDKRIDVLATAIGYGAKAEDLFHLDLAYAPSFSSAKDPVHYLGMVLENAVNQSAPIITPEELETLLQKGERVQIVDARPRREFESGHIQGAVNIPLSQMRQRYEELDREAVIVTCCYKGVTGHLAQNLLQNQGFSRVYNLSGGNVNHEGFLCIPK